MKIKIITIFSILAGSGLLVTSIIASDTIQSSRVNNQPVQTASPPVQTIVKPAEPTPLPKPDPVSVPSTSTYSSSDATVSDPSVDYSASDNTSTDYSASDTSSYDGYTNVDGNYVPSPNTSGETIGGYSPTYTCSDGTYSYAQHSQGACSHHGGL
jgi:hypothetical protein